MTAIEQLLRHLSGLDLPPATVAAAVGQRMQRLGLSKPADYVQLAQSSKNEQDALIQLVVVPETWFYRDAAAFSAATRFVLDCYPQRRLPVRLLSVPCATGEEPYTLAMSLLDAGILPSQFAIEGLDVCQAGLAKARRGLFGDYAFRSKDLAFRQRYFERTDAGYQLCRQVMGLVAFRQGSLLQLAQYCPDGGYDLIFCRNLLIYFDDPTRLAAIEQLRSALADDGMLLAGPSEVPVFCKHGFRSLALARSFALIKTERAQQPPIAMVSVAAQKPALARPAPLARSNVKTALFSPAVPPPAPPSPLHPNWQTQLAMAQRLADQGDLAAAARLCQQVLNQQPEAVNAHYLLGLAHSANQDLNQAEVHLRRSLYLDPNHYAAICHLAMLAEQRGDLAAAQTLRQRAARVYQRQVRKSAS